MLLLMSYQLIVPLEDEEALLALVVATGRPGESAAVLPFLGVGRRLVLVDLPRLLPGILEPDHNDPWAEAEQLGEVLEVVVFGIGIVFKKLLQDFDLVVCESGPVGSFSLMTGSLLTLRSRRSLLLGLLICHHVSQGIEKIGQSTAQWGGRTWKVRD